MVEIPEAARRQMNALQTRYYLPVQYDALTWVQRREVREQYILDQKGLCWHCKERLDGPPPERITCLPLNPKMFGRNLEFLKHPIHLHHDHRTGLTIGATHAYCNAVLAQYYGE